MFVTSRLHAVAYSYGAWRTDPNYNTLVSLTTYTTNLELWQTQR